MTKPRSSVKERLSLPFSLLLVVTYGCGVRQESNDLSRENAPLRVQKIEALLATGEFAEAEKQTRAALAVAPQNLAEQDRELTLLLGDALSGLGNFSAAIDAYHSVAGLDELGRTAILRQAEAEKKAGYFYRALETLQRGRANTPDDPRFTIQLGIHHFDLGMTWEAMPFFEALLRQGIAPRNVLILMINCRKPLEPDEKLLTQGLTANPSDLRPLVSKALKVFQLKPAESLAITQEVLASHSDFAPAYLLLGRLWARLRPQELGDWFLEAPRNCKPHPDFWLVCGMWAEEVRDYPVAARCFCEAVARDPNFLLALQRLAKVLTLMDRPAEAQIVKDRLAVLAEIEKASDRLLTLSPNSQRVALELAEAFSRAGRDWEAVAWTATALDMSEDLVPNGRQKLDQLSQKLRTDLPLVRREHQVAIHLPYDTWPLPSKEFVTRGKDFFRERLADSGQPNQRMVSSHGFRFRDEATERGMLFEYRNGADPERPEMMLHQSNGGGVAVIDYDLDGWPDLYFSQAGGSPLKAETNAPGVLFQNHRGRFRDTTSAAQVGAVGFGQGVACGDINDDGFPDLLVSGVQFIQLYVNNGDGTFTLLPQERGLKIPEGWCTSGLIADVNSDGYADIYQARYIAGEEVFRQRCFDPTDPEQTRVCRPTNFPAAPDLLYFGNGDGTFRDGSSLLQHNASPGRGFGLLAANLDGKPGLELFVANDMSENHLWQFSDDLADGGRESAVLRGLATNGQAISQACMGVAAADVDMDGMLDLVVTNFTDESNCFYRQIQAGVFRDDATRTGMDELSLHLLGFGVQFADWDLDGRQELLIANGHIDIDKNHGYQMPMQLLGFDPESQRWTEFDRALAGEYLAAPHLGRALAVLDANRDFLPDAVLSSLVEPAALLINGSEAPGQAIRLRLVARMGHRDAVGTQVTWWQGEKRRVVQRTAGDGFQCTNEGTVTLGLGEVARADKILIQWPSGQTDELTDVNAGKEYLVVEGKKFLESR